MLRTLSFAFGRGSLGLSSTMIGRNRPWESLWYVFPGAHINLKYQFPHLTLKEWISWFDHWSKISGFSPILSMDLTCMALGSTFPSWAFCRSEGSSTIRWTSFTLSTASPFKSSNEASLTWEKVIFQSGNVYEIWDLFLERLPDWKLKISYLSAY